GLHRGPRSSLHPAEVHRAMVLVFVPLPYLPPFHSSSRSDRDQSSCDSGRTGITFSRFKKFFRGADLAGSRGLLRCCRRGGSRCAARTPRGALLALLRKFLLALQVL